MGNSVSTKAQLGFSMPLFLPCCFVSTTITVGLLSGPPARVLFVTNGYSGLTFIQMSFLYYCCCLVFLVIWCRYASDNLGQSADHCNGHMIQTHITIFAQSLKIILFNISDRSTSGKIPSVPIYSAGPEYVVFFVCDREATVQVHT